MPAFDEDACWFGAARDADVRLIPALPASIISSPHSSVLISAIKGGGSRIVHMAGPAF